MIHNPNCISYSRTFELLHDDKDPLRCLEHPLQVNDTRVVEVLEDGDLVLQGGLLLGGEAHLVDDLEAWVGSSQVL